MFFGFIHGEAIERIYKNNYEQLLVDGGFNRGSGAYFSGGINAWKKLRDGIYEFPPLSKDDHKQSVNKDLHLQQIYYGAPGTGKSHEIKKMTEWESVIRTTFHPRIGSEGQELLYTIMRRYSSWRRLMEIEKD